MALRILNDHQSFEKQCCLCLHLGGLTS